MEKLTHFEKQLIGARYWLLGMAEHDPEYFKCIAALEKCVRHHDGIRNGGEPEWSHMVGIFHSVRTKHKHIKNPVLVYCLVFLHDMVEDPNQKTKAYVSIDEIRDEFGDVIAAKLRKISKEILGQKNPDYDFDVIFADEDLSIVKGGDRCNNVSTMMGVFKQARLERYVRETVDEFLPRLKAARRKFPHQEAIYEAFKLELVNQLQLIQYIIDGYKVEQ